MKYTASIFLSCSLLLLLQTRNGVKAGYLCVGSPFSAHGSYAKNRNSLLSSLSKKVIINGGFYNTSRTTKSSRGVYALALCRRGYEQQSCFSCVEKAIRQIKRHCRKVESYNWDGDDGDTVLCLVRTTNHSTFRKLEMGPATRDRSPVTLDPSWNNMTMFRQEWESMVNRTIEAGTGKDENSTMVLKYYGAVKAQFTEFPNVYMMMQCTPDITSGECKKCLRESVAYFRHTYWGSEGGSVCRPSCFFRWDRYAFYAAFANLTSVPAPPRPLIPGAQAISVTRLKGRNIAIIVVPTVINICVLIGLLRAYGQMRKSKKEINGRSVCARVEQNCDSNGQIMLPFDLDMILIATDDFSSENKLGEGGFGTVYKGALPNGQEIAVKRLVTGSGQGDLEFKNEVLLLTKLQHRNLVKLLGFCDEGDEAILVYEFIPNSSLDHFIFHEDKRLLLTWELRCRIIEGVARGLLYLHEDSQLRIIHRDLKPSNILLDTEMNPKVSDFGLARLFDTDQTRGVTSRVVGTYGYMAPEYLRNGRFSVKTDVYSFGVVLLEMITGKCNKTYFEACGLPAYTWKCWVAGEAASIIDPVLSKSPTNEVMRFIHIGLLCVQDNVANRPTMSSVIQWFGGETIAIPLPTAAAFTTHLHINSLDTDPSAITESEAGASSMNEVSIITEFSPR